MADLYNSDLGANTRRTRPSSEFGTPRLTPLILNTDSESMASGNSSWCPNDTDEDNLLISSDFQNRNSDVFKAVQAISQYCEIYEVGGSSDSNIITIVCRDSSIPYDAGSTFLNEGSTVTKLQNAVRSAVGSEYTLVYIGRITDDDTDG